MQLTLSFNNVYFYLKSLEVTIFEKFMKSRKLMINLVKIENK